jgi:hypothetical protein
MGLAFVGGPPGLRLTSWSASTRPPGPPMKMKNRDSISSPVFQGVKKSNATRARLWRRHSCLPRRDSSRRFSIVENYLRPPPPNPSRKRERPSLAFLLLPAQPEVPVLLAFFAWPAFPGI